MGGTCANKATTHSITKYNEDIIALIGATRKGITRQIIREKSPRYRNRVISGETKKFAIIPIGAILLNKTKLIGLVAS